MNLSRRDLLGFLGVGAATSVLQGCCGLRSSKDVRSKIALQLYSLHRYISGEKGKDVAGLVTGHGFAKTFEALSAIGYKGVEFAGYEGLDAKSIRKMLDDSGLKAVGSHVGGWRQIQGDKLKTLADFNLELGNNVLICPGGTAPDKMDWSNPRWDSACEEHMKFITEFFNERAETAAKYGCRVGIHNHEWEFQLKDDNGVCFWDRFFSGTSQDVLMEQDVGWATCAGADPVAEFRKYPGRSPLLHAKENGMGKDVKKFDGILGRPGEPGSVPVDWDRLIPASEANGTEWYVVECERHFDDLSAVTASYNFLKSKGLN